MTPKWFIKGVITSLIINFMGKCGEANTEEQQEEAKYLEKLGLSRTAKDEKAFQMVKDRIKDVLKQEQSRTFYTPHDEGPRRHFYKKYMKLGKSRDESIDYDKKETQHLSQSNFNKFKGNTAKNFEKKFQDLQKISAIGKKERNDITIDKLYNSQGDKWKIGIEPDILSGRISNNDKYPKENYSNTNNLLVNTSSYLKNEGNFPKNVIHETNEVDTLKINDEKYKLINNYLDQMKNKKDKYLDKHNLHEKSKITNKDIEGINRIANDQPEQNSSVNSILRTSKSFKVSHGKKKRKCYRFDKKTIENKKKEECKKLQLKDHRKVRSCDIKMEDLRESFIPNEQLSIYHPKMSLSDQFILQDTMF